MNTIVVLNQSLSKIFTALLEGYGRVRIQGIYQGDLFEGAQIVVSTSVDPVNAELLNALPESVRLIANIGVGTDNINLSVAASRGIVISNTPVVTDDTADLVMSLILAASRRINSSEHILREGGWPTAQHQLGSRVHGKTLGIVGLGAIGQAVAHRASGFSMPLLYWGPNRKPEAEQALGAKWCSSLEGLLANADIISIHCPLNSDTHHLMNAERLSLCKSGAILINTSRGPLIDEHALVSALREGILAAAGLDVFEFEPQINPGLLELDNVVLTPHIGSATAECRKEMMQSVMANIESYLRKGVPINVVA